MQQVQFGCTQGDVESAGYHLLVKPIERSHQSQQYPLQLDNLIVGVASDQMPGSDLLVFGFQLIRLCILEGLSFSG
jgi:hypothetical protein